MKCKSEAEPNHTLRELIDIIRAKTQELGRVPARREIKESDSCRKFFGSWNNAIIAADLQQIALTVNECTNAYYKSSR